MFGTNLETNLLSSRTILKNEITLREMKCIILITMNDVHSLQAIAVQGLLTHAAAAAIARTACGCCCD